MNVILYGKAIDPATRQVILMLEEQKIPFKLDLLQTEAEGQISLTVGSDLRFFGSYAILEYLESTNVSLFGETHQIKGNTRNFLQNCEQDLGYKITYPLVFEKITKFIKRLGTPDYILIKQIEQSIPSALSEIDAYLKDQAYVVANHLTFADLALAAHISCLDYLNNIKWKQFNGLYNWFLAIKSRPSFATILAETVLHIKPSKNYQLLDFEQQ